MHNFFKRINLQLFAGEGASSGAGDGSAGVGAEGTAADAGQDNSLETLGVPREKAEKYRAKYGSRSVQQRQQVPQEQDAAAAADPEEPVTPKKSLKDALRENPDWNMEEQAMVQGRVKNLKETCNQQAQTINTMSQILATIAADYNIHVEDGKELDLEALSNAIESDPRRYHDIALEMNVEDDVAAEIYKTRNENKRLKEARDAEQRDMQARMYFRELERQGAELAKEIPGFDLMNALQEKEFYFRTLPVEYGGKGLGVKESWMGLHGDEIYQQRLNAAVKGANTALANNLRAGNGRPSENGIVQRTAPSTQETPYSRLDAAGRKEWVRQAKLGKKF